MLLIDTSCIFIDRIFDYGKGYSLDKPMVTVTCPRIETLGSNFI